MCEISLYLGIESTASFSSNLTKMGFLCSYLDYGCGYSCTVKKVFPASEMVSFIGQHDNDKTKEDVDSFFIRNLQPLEGFQNDVFEEFQSLRIVIIKGCGLKKLSNDCLIRLENLEVLDVQSNDLSHLPDDLFVGMKKLEVINFNHNKLERLSSKLLQPIGCSLKGAYFLRNAKIDDYFNINEPGKDDLNRFMDSLDYLVFPELETEPRIENGQTIVLSSTGEFTISDTLSKANALAVFNLVYDSKHPLKQAAFKVIQEMLPEVLDNMFSKPDCINKLMAAKREIDAILDAARND